MTISSIQIPPITPLNSSETSKSPSSAINQLGKTFNTILNSLSEQQNNSDNLMQQLAAGEDVDVHDVIISAEQTDINFRVALAIRNKLVDAYREIMRMSV